MEHTVEFSAPITYDDHSGVSFWKNTDKPINADPDLDAGCGVTWICGSAFEITNGVATQTGGSASLIYSAGDLTLTNGNTYAVEIDASSIGDGSGTIFLDGSAPVPLDTVGVHQYTCTAGATSALVIQVTTLNADPVVINSIKLLDPEESTSIVDNSGVDNQTVTYDVTWDNPPDPDNGDTVEFRYDPTVGNYRDGGGEYLKAIALDCTVCPLPPLENLFDNANNWTNVSPWSHVGDLAVDYIASGAASNGIKGLTTPLISGNTYRMVVDISGLTVSTFQMRLGTQNTGQTYTVDGTDLTLEAVCDNTGTGAGFRSTNTTNAGVSITNIRLYDLGVV